MQRVIDLDAFLNSSYSDMKPLGSLKLTNQKFYRINGGATQLKGVNSDIVLPDNFQLIDIGEKELDYPMQWTEIAPASFITYNKPVQNIDELRKISAERIKKSEQFTLVDENAKFLKEQRDKTLLPLNLEEHKANQERIKSMNKKFENIDKEIAELKPQPLQFDQKRIASDTTFKTRSETWMKELKKDAYINEAISILKDMK